MMNGRLKNAPNMGVYKNDGTQEMMILVGNNALNFYRDDTYRTLLHQSNLISLNEKPVYLGKDQLKEVLNLKIAPSQIDRIKFIKCGNLSDDEIDCICSNLAKNTKTTAFSPQQIITLIDMHGNVIKNLSDQVASMRNKGNEHPINQAIQATQEEKQDNVTERIEYREGDLKGLYYIKPIFKEDRMIGERVFWLCDKIELVGKGKNDNSDYFYIFRWQNADEKQHRIEAVNCGDFGTESAWRLLKSKGFKMSPKTSLVQHLVEFFHKKSLIAELWTITHSTGWHNGAYLLPNGEIIGKPTKPLIFKNKSANANGYDTKGTLASWQAEIAYYVNKNSSMMLGIAAALASPILRLINAKSFGVHLFNSSSKGKTTTLNIANSVYGNPDLIDLSWNTTPTALNNEAASRNDGFITLDELGQAKKLYDVENIAYSLFNEKGRAKGIKEGGNDELSRWKITALSTGEKDVEGFLKSKGIDINAGQLIRLLNIPLIEANHLHGFSNNKTHADHLNEASLNHYGVVGREWIKYITENQDFIKAEYQRYKKEWAERLTENSASQVQRVASNFAILETALQTARHLTQWSEADNRECLIQSFNNWLADYGTGDREEAKIIEYFNGWLDESAESCFIQIPEPTNPRTINKIFGYRILEVQGLEREHFYIHPKAFNDKIHDSGYPKKIVFEVMEKNKMIRQGREQNVRPYQHKAPASLEKKINSKGKRFYIVYPALIED